MLRDGNRRFASAGGSLKTIDSSSRGEGKSVSSVLTLGISCESADLIASMFATPRRGERFAPKNSRRPGASDAIAELFTGGDQ